MTLMHVFWDAVSCPTPSPPERAPAPVSPAGLEGTPLKYEGVGGGGGVWGGNCVGTCGGWRAVMNYQY